MNFARLLVLGSFLLFGTESIAAEPNNFNLTQQKCGDLFVPYDFPKKLNDISVNGFARACVETISSPDRLLLRMNMLVSLKEFAKTRDEALRKFNEKQTCSGDGKNYVQLEGATIKFQDRALPETKFDHVSLSIATKAWQCRSGSKAWWLPHAHFDINVPIVVISNNETVGLGAGEANVSFYTGTTFLDWMFEIGDEIKNEVKSNLASFKLALPLTREQFAAYRPQMKRVKYRFSNDVLLVDILGQAELPAPEVRGYLIKMIPK